jgi:phenylacetaldehyde dehydrogenase
MLIGGRWVPAGSGQLLDVFDPSTASVLARVAAGGAADIDAAVKAARRAFSSSPWAKLRAAERARLLYRLAEVVEANA